MTVNREDKIQAAQRVKARLLQRIASDDSMRLVLELRAVTLALISLRQSVSVVDMLSE